MSNLKKMLKAAVLFFYVHLYSNVRNFVLSLSGSCHIAILVYHRVSDDYKDSVTVSINKFESQMKYLKSNYKIITLEELPLIYNTRLKKPVLAITFDDGYADNYEAARFLSSQNIKATFFITTKIVGSSNPFQHDLKRLGIGVPVLSWNHVYEMSKWGHSFGSHTATHPNLSTLSDEEAMKEIAEGQQDLHEKLGNAASIDLFAYPHGRKEDLSEGVRSFLPELGIKYCFSAYGGINYSGFDPYDIRRQAIDHSFSDLAFRAAVEGWKVRVPKRQ